jgi:hypothetical protein
MKRRRFLLLQRGFLPRCCSDNKARAHTQQQHEKYMCARGRVVLKLAAIYQQQVSPLNTHLKGAKAEWNWHETQPAIAPRWCLERPIYKSR